MECPMCKGGDVCDRCRSYRGCLQRCDACRGDFCSAPNFTNFPEYLRKELDCFTGHDCQPKAEEEKGA